MSLYLPSRSLDSCCKKAKSDLYLVTMSNNSTALKTWLVEKMSVRMNQARYYHTADLIGNQLVVCGGRTARDFTNILVGLSSCESMLIPDVELVVSLNI